MSLLIPSRLDFCFLLSILSSLASSGLSIDSSSSGSMSCAGGVRVLVVVLSAGVLLRLMHLVGLLPSVELGEYPCDLFLFCVGVSSLSSVYLSVLMGATMSAPSSLSVV